MNILADASLPCLPDAFPAPFHLHLFDDNRKIPALMADKQILICRSTLRIDADTFPSLPFNFVATASSGTDHIDEHYLQQNNIRLISAKGCNAQAVCDYVLASLAWLRKNKLFCGSKIGVIGVGAVGTQIVQRLRKLGMEIICYDPPKAMTDPSFSSCKFRELYSCDVITVHANLHTQQPHPSWHLLDEDFFKHYRGILINAARGDIVNENKLLQYDQIIYCTDVYYGEPNVNPAIIDRATLCTPHIAGHSIEAKIRAVYLLSEQLHKALSLPPPLRPQQLKTTACPLNKSNWEDIVLKHYNPDTESQQLKLASDKKLCFIDLRKAHNFRHDMNIST